MPRKNSETTKKKVKGSLVARAAMSALRTSSSSWITEISAVALISTIQTLPRPGRAKRHICGMTMRRKVSAGPMPAARAASICPRGTARKAPRKTSVANAP